MVRVMRSLLFVLVLFLTGCATYPQARLSVAHLPAAEQARARENLQVFYAVWDLVNRKHYEPKLQHVDWEKSAATYGPQAVAARNTDELYEVLNRMLGELQDSHTRALTPDEALERRTRLRARHGFAMTRVEDRWVVTEVTPDSPAAEVGVQAGWVIVTRDGVPLGARPDYHATENQKVRWEFLDHRDQVIALMIEARRITTAAPPAVRELPGGVVYLRFDEFNVTNRRWFGRQVAEHRHAPGVIVDLRRNSGGGTISLGMVIGEFFDRAVDCGTFITRQGVQSVKNSWQLGSAHYRGEVVLLIEGGTASAAEILAAVLRDHDRATLIGRRTAGAVLASWFYGLPDGGQLQLSRENYLSPSGSRIEGAGVAPDITVERTLGELRAGRDADLDAALAILQREDATEAALRP